MAHDGGAAASQNAVARLLFGDVRHDYAIDLNGDGKLDRQFPLMVRGLAGDFGLDVQGSQDLAVEAGASIWLVDVAAASNDPLATVLWSTGQRQPAPDFGGNGRFIVDESIPTATFCGTVVDGTFSSTDPATTTAPVTLRLHGLQLFAGAPPIDLTLYGAHLTYRTNDCPPDPSDEELPDGGIIDKPRWPRCGTLQGAICERDVQSVLVPNVAAGITALIQSNPGSANSMGLSSLLDTGDNNGGHCTGVDGVVGKPMDGIVAACELTGDDSFARAYFFPDVQMFSDDGCAHYAPNPKNEHLDSMSFAVGLDLVPAQH